MSENTVTLTDANFDTELANSEVPILVDFWAEWCGPCKMIAPILDEIAAENAGKVRIGKLDIDSNPGVAQRFGIQSIPTMILFKNGEQQATMIGAKPKNSLLNELAPHIG
jgi:thioredoxin 1